MKIATLVIGLPDDSRLKRKLSGNPISAEVGIMSQILDSCNLLLWSKTKDASKGRNRPKSLFKLLAEPKENPHKGFDNGKEFDEWLKQSAQPTSK